MKYFAVYARNLFLVFVLVPFASLIQGQTLERKGTFGAQIEAVDEGPGIRVIKVFSPTTASALGVQEGDILLQVNEHAFEEVGPLVDSIGHWRVNDPLALTLEREGIQLNLKGKVVGKPFETSEYAEVIYGQVNFDGGMLRSILELPHKVENPPVVFFLPGVGCGSLDYYYNPNSTTKLLVEELVKAGLAVYRVEKPGMGDSQGTQECLEMDFNYEVEAFGTALQQLRKIEGIDARQIYLYGHSLGVVSAPLIASKYDVAGIVAWGGISTTWYEYSLKILREQNVLLGWDYAEIDSNFRRVSPFYHAFYQEQQSPEQLRSKPEFAPIVAEQFQGDLWHGLHHYRYFQTLAEKDIRTAYKEANCPVLAVAGEMDLHAIDTDWAKDIADVVNSYRPGTAEYAHIPATTHHYHTVPSMEVYNQMRRDGTMNSSYQAANFNPKVPAVVANWIMEQVENPPSKSPASADKG